MKLSAPRQITFWVAVVVVVLGILSELLNIPEGATYQIWIVVVGFVILLLGNLLEGV